ncbi:MAG: DUF4013 domain-containing protein [Haloferacaceae archaeon]
MLRDSLGVLYRGDDAVGTVLVGAALTGLSAVALLGWLLVFAVSPPVGLAVTPAVVLPGLIVRGHRLRVVAAGVAMRPAAPPFVRWGALLRGGVRSAILAAGYVIPVVALGVLTAGVLTAGVVAADDAPSLAALATLVGAVGLLGVLSVGLLTAYLWPAANAVLAATGSLRRAANPFRAVRLALTAAYASGWLLAAGLLVGGPALLVPALAFGVLLGLLNPLVAFVWLLASLLSTVGLWFVGRTSAAWTTGRSVADALGPHVASSVRPAGAAGVATATAGPAASMQGSPPAIEPTPPRPPHEVPPAIQVGRDVDPTDGAASSSEPIEPGVCRLYPPLLMPDDEN